MYMVFTGKRLNITNGSNDRAHPAHFQEQLFYNLPARILVELEDLAWLFGSTSHHCTEFLIIDSSILKIRQN